MQAYWPDNFMRSKSGKPLIVMAAGLDGHFAMHVETGVWHEVEQIPRPRRKADPVTNKSTLALLSTYEPPDDCEKRLTVASARPLLEDWAKMYGVTIKWFHEWVDGADQCVTAFGVEQNGAYNHNTLRVATKNL